MTEATRAKAAESALSDTIDSKIYIDGTSAESLSAIHVDDEIYYQKVAEGTVKENELYILSSEDCVNCFDQALLDNEIWTLICHARGRVFLIFDCCHSETMF